MPIASTGDAVGNYRINYTASLGQVGTYYLAAVVSDGTHARVAYAVGELTIKTPGLVGDANLDGVVDLRDYLIMDANYLSGFDGTPGHFATWQDGDFNGDGIVNAADYALIDQAFGAEHSASVGTTGAVSGGPGLGVGAMPESGGIVRFEGQQVSGAGSANRLTLGASVLAGAVGVSVLASSLTVPAVGLLQVGDQAAETDVRDAVAAPSDGALRVAGVVAYQASMGASATPFSTPGAEWLIFDGLRGVGEGQGIGAVQLGGGAVGDEFSVRVNVGDSMNDDGQGMGYAASDVVTMFSTEAERRMSAGQRGEGVRWVGRAGREYRGRMFKG